MNAKLADVIANRPFKDTRGLEKLGPYEAGAKKLVDDILGNIDAMLASGVPAKLSDEDAPGLQFDVSVTFEKFRLEAYLAPLLRNLRLLDPRRTEFSSMFLMQLLGACYRAGQLTPNETIAEDILTPVIARKLHSARGKLGGDSRGKQKQAEADKKWRDAALREAKRICSSGKFIRQRDLAQTIIDTGIKCPDDVEYVVKIIRSWEKNGELKRPKNR